MLCIALNSSDDLMNESHFRSGLLCPVVKVSHICCQLSKYIHLPTGWSFRKEKSRELLPNQKGSCKKNSEICDIGQSSSSFSPFLSHNLNQKYVYIIIYIFVRPTGIFKNFFKMTLVHWSWSPSLLAKFHFFSYIKILIFSWPLPPSWPMSRILLFFKTSL